MESPQSLLKQWNWTLWPGNLLWDIFVQLAFRFCLDLLNYLHKQVCIFKHIMDGDVISHQGEENTQIIFSNKSIKWISHKSIITIACNLGIDSWKFIQSASRMMTSIPTLLHVAGSMRINCSQVQGQLYTHMCTLNHEEMYE